MAPAHPQLAAWFQAEHVGLYRLALLLTGHPSLAEDLVQDTFVRLSLSGARPDREGISTYARRTLVNLHRSRLRRTYREQRALERVAARTEHAMPAPADPTDPTLLRALGRLPAKQRAVVALRYFEDRSEDDTAAILGIAKGTVKSHTHRALDALRAALSEIDTERS